MTQTETGQKYFQLTHDYLVHSLRDWLTRKQNETRKGRAELKLAERSALWNAKLENRHLPSLTEWISIRALTESQHRTAPQRVMMDRAGQVHGLRTGLAAALLLAVIFTGLRINKAVNDRQEKLVAQKQEELHKAEATRLIEGLLTADTAQVGASLISLKDFRSWADPQLKKVFQDSPAESNARLHAGLALLADDQTADPAVLDFLRERLLTVTRGQFGPIRKLLEPRKTELTSAYWKLVTDDQQPAGRRFHAACALAGFDATHAIWNDANFTKFVAEQLVAVNPVFVGQYQEVVRQVAPQLVPALTNIFKDPARGELTKTLATSLLADYASKDPDTLTELVLAADVVSDKSLFPVLHQHHPAAVKNLETVLHQRLEPDWKDAPLDPAWTTPSPAVRTQIESAHGLIAVRFAFCQDMPLPKFLELVEALRPSGYRPTRIRPYLSLSRASSLLSFKGEKVADRPDQGVLSSQVSAIWTRDGNRWHLDPSLKRSDLPTPDAPAAKNDLLLTDIAVLPYADPSTEPQFIALWCELSAQMGPSDGSLAPSGPSNSSSPSTELRRVLLDVSEAELTAAQTELTKQGFISQSTITVRTDSLGQRQYTDLRSNHGALSELRPAYAGFELVEQPQWDVAVAPAARPADPLETFRQQLAQIEKLPGEKLPGEKLHDPQVREARATANYKLGNLEPALVDLDFLVGQASSQPPSDPLYLYRTQTLARLGRADEAKESLAKYLATDAPASFKTYLQILVPAWLGEFEQASQQLESAATASSQSADDLYNTACAAALSLQASVAKDAAQSQKFADRTMELLRQLVAQGYSNAERLKADPDFASLHQDPRFIELLAQLEQPARYSALWRADVEFESKLLAAVPIDHLLEQLNPLIAAGFRPFMIAIDTHQVTHLRGFTPTARQQTTATVTQPVTPIHSPPGNKGENMADRPDEGSSALDQADWKPAPLFCSLILHRPNIPDEKKETLALKQAAAATALLRLNAAEKVWPLFRDQPDPRVRSYLLQRLANYGVDPQSLFTQLQQESDVSRQRALILGIGKFARLGLPTAATFRESTGAGSPGQGREALQLLSPEQRTAVIVDLAKRYADDPDPGIHGAAEWTLRHLGAETAIAQVRAAYSTGAVVGDRRWYLTKMGSTSSSSTGQTFAIIQPKEESLMGSPVTEVERFQGPTGKNESRHRRRIGRKYAIGTHEITVAQFSASRSEHQFDRTKARQEDSPANNIAWYDAAAYCNWLSKEEGLPREQWCYDPDQLFEDGMTLVPDYLQRTGYRLPSEAEWEYACRAGTTTSRYFGETETLLGEYAWYAKTSGDKWILQVGTLKPNGAGLFDMLGNVNEWCQDAKLPYDADREWMGDKEQTGTLSNSNNRVLRGGSFIYIATLVRLASRISYQPSYRFFNNGFRVARTLPFRNSPHSSR